MAANDSVVQIPINNISEHNDIVGNVTGVKAVSIDLLNMQLTLSDGGGI